MPVLQPVPAVPGTSMHGLCLQLVLDVLPGIDGHVLALLRVLQQLLVLHWRMHDGLLFLVLQAEHLTMPRHLRATPRTDTTWAAAIL